MLIIYLLTDNNYGINWFSCSEKLIYSHFSIYNIYQSIFIIIYFSYFLIYSFLY